ncbi:hypothetical protein ACQR1W_28160 [Bradyrhizobium sp. HKCCYLS1011]|uniref:hypothetical protein n=1 Tax=Bradyrhizobium sp. HKCCYLS1011 TaxID=3420733 RepID=UPI003EB71FDD
MGEVREYLSEKGTSPFGRWFDDLDPQAAAIVTIAIGRLAEGNTSNVKSIGEVQPSCGSIADLATGFILDGTAARW